MSYARFNNPEDIRRLDINTEIDEGVNYSEFPGFGFYKKRAFPTSQYTVCSGPRDKNVNYVLDIERYSHPDNFSRYSYYYGGLNGGIEYIAGNQSRGYLEPSYCLSNYDPPGLAPENYYQNHYSPLDAPAYYNSYKIRNPTYT